MRQDPVRASDKHYGSERKIATSMCDDNPRGQWYFRPATDIAMGAAAGEPCGRVTPYEGESSLLPDRFPTDPGCWEQIWSRFITRHASTRIDGTETKKKYGAWSYITEGVFKGGTIPWRQSCRKNAVIIVLQNTSVVGSRSGVMMTWLTVYSRPVCLVQIWKSRSAF